MTGYGRAEQMIGDKTFLIEIKSLNGKQFDLRLTLPALLKPYEFDVRNLLNEGLERGSVECMITIKSNGASRPVTINTDLLKAYYTSVTAVAKELNADVDQLLAAILRLPEVVVNSTEMLHENDWNLFKGVLQTAIANLNAHREDEGKSLIADLLQKLANIELHQENIKALEPIRREKIKEGLLKVLHENVGKENYDANRFEQELIFYLEKLDINEEKVRLANHCKYFLETIEETVPTGKKLGFISQELGREINTIGSKANSTDIQKFVVQMKDHLERIKEQLLNVL